MNCIFFIVRVDGLKVLSFGAALGLDRPEQKNNVSDMRASQKPVRTHATTRHKSVLVSVLECERSGFFQQGSFLFLRGVFSVIHPPC